MIENQSQPSTFDPSSEYGSIQPSEFRSDNTTAGVLLQEAREAVGLHIDALAVVLKVPVKKLEALEMDRYDLLPDAVFTRALASSVCRTLKVDPAPILALLPTSGLPAFQSSAMAEPAAFSPYHPAMKSMNAKRRSSISATAAIAGTLLVLGAVLVLFLPQIRAGVASWNGSLPMADSAQQWVARLTPSMGHSEATSDATGDVPVPGIVEVSGPKSVAIAPSEASGLTASDRLGSSKLASATGANASNSTSASQGNSGGVPAALRSSSDLSVSDGVVAFITTGQSSWVKVTDARGAVVFSRTVTPGEEARAGGVLPLSVVVGRADATRVTVRGAALDLGPFARENVARFEVK